MSMSDEKKTSRLTYNDYLRYPIWGFVDDEDGEKMPVEYPGYFIWPEGGGDLWVLGQFELNDQSIVPGVVGIRMLNHSLYLLKFVRNDATLLTFFTSGPLWDLVKPEEVAAVLGRTVDQVFPLKYTTPYVFKNGHPLIGEFGLEQHSAAPWDTQP